MNKVIIANTFCKRLLGLIPFGKLKAPLLFIPDCKSIHTFFMRFSITAMFLDRNFKIIKIKTNLKPFRICRCKQAKHVLEIPILDHS